MKYTIITSAKRNNVREFDFDSLATAKAEAERVANMKRGWTSEWRIVQKNKHWGLTVKNSKGVVVGDFALIKGMPAVEKPESKAAAAPQKPEKKVVARMPRAKGKRVAKRPSTNPDGSKHVGIMPGQTVEVTIHRGGTLIINYK